MQTTVHGGDIYTYRDVTDFSANLNPLGMPLSVREAAVDGARHSEQYPDVRQRALRSAVAGKEQIPEEQIIFGNGAAELIFAAAAAQRPSKALLTAPGFAEYEAALQAAGAEIGWYTCTRENDFLIGEDFISCLQEDVDMVFLCNPNNPTGISIPQERLLRIARICHEKQIRLILDECFIGLWPEGEAASLKSRLAEMPNMLILRAFTKLYAMAGLRLGYGLCADQAFLERMSRQMQPWNISIPAQTAGTAAMALPDYERQTRAFVARELRFLKDGFDRLGIRYWESEANYLFFESRPDLQERLLEKKILIRSCSNYRGLGPGYFRTAVRTREENERLLEALRQVMQEIRVS